MSKVKVPNLSREEIFTRAVFQTLAKEKRRLEQPRDGVHRAMRTGDPNIVSGTRFMIERREVGK